MTGTSLRERQDALIAALRGGEYEQGRRRLRRGDAFCCLGVACDLYKKETGVGAWQPVLPKSTEPHEERAYRFASPGTDGDAAYLPPYVKEYFGFHNGSGSTLYVDSPADHELGLANLNDHGGKTFTEIADVIEENRHKYFKTEEGARD